MTGVTVSGNRLSTWKKRYRLIAAVHYNTQIVYTLMILTHRDYDRGAWKDQL